MDVQGLTLEVEPLMIANNVPKVPEG
jgi:hypothetical protein